MTDYLSMRHTLVVAALVLAGCGSSPTAPTPPPIVTPPPVVVVPPVVIVPPVATFPPNDPRFDAAFYRQFAHGALELGHVVSLRRQTQAPRIYLRTVDDAGAPIDAFTLNETAAALENVAGSLTGVFGLAGLERGTDSRQGQPGWITVRWSQFPEEVTPTYSMCGRAINSGDLIMLYPKSRWCRCGGGGPAVVLTIVKHELGHALGFYHTDNREDLMFPTYNACNQQPTAREVYHAALAYTRPIGSPAP